MFNQRSINTMSDKNCVKSICNVREKMSIPEIGGNQIYDVEVKPVILERTIANSKVMFQGEIALKFIYSTNQTWGVGTKEMKVPFEYDMEVANVTVNTNISTEIEVINQNFIVGNDGMIEGRVDLCFLLNVSNTLQINIIDDVNMDETRDKEIYSMVIYFVKPKDTLWSIAKQFGSTISDIVRVNKIEDENKIYPGQQLFIPKYVYTKREATA